MNFLTVSVMTMHYLCYESFGLIRAGDLIHCELFLSIVKVESYSVHIKSQL